MSFLRLLPTAVLASSLLVPSLAGAADWAGFRGSGATGISAGTGIPLAWSDTKNLAWKVALPGKGFSSPIVVGERVLVTCYSGGTGNLSGLKRHLVCVDRNTGKVLWKSTVARAYRNGMGNGARATPTIAGDTVVVFTGEGRLVALETKTGEITVLGLGNLLERTLTILKHPHNQQ